MSAENVGLLNDRRLPSLQGNSVKNGPKKIFGKFNNKYQAKYKNSSHSLNRGISTGN